MTLPGTATAPPMTTMRPTRGSRPGSRCSASARLVSGPSATTTSSSPKRSARLENQIGPVAHLNGQGRARVARAAIGLDEPVEVSEPVVAMDVAGGHQRSLERGRRRPARRAERWIGPAAARMRRALAVAWSTDDVAGHGGDGLDRRLGRGAGEEDRERIVDAGVGVDQQGPGI